jgi:hypothetical protein
MLPRNHLPECSVKDLNLQPSLCSEGTSGLFPRNAPARTVAFQTAAARTEHETRTSYRNVTATLALAVLLAGCAKAAAPVGQVEAPPPVPTGIAMRTIHDDWVYGIVRAIDDSTRGTTCYVYHGHGISCLPLR